MWVSLEGLKLVYWSTLLPSSYVPSLHNTPFSPSLKAHVLEENVKHGNTCIYIPYHFFYILLLSVRTQVSSC